MLRIASLPALGAAAGHAARPGLQSSLTNKQGSGAARRRSIAPTDVAPNAPSRPRSASSHDLHRLEGRSPVPSRSCTPAVHLESLTEALEGTLAQLAAMGCGLDLEDSQLWAKPGATLSAGLERSENPDLQSAAATADSLLPSPFLTAVPAALCAAAAATQPVAPAAAAYPHYPQDRRPSAARMAPDTAAPFEIRVHKTAMSFTYIQELLANMAQVQEMTTVLAARAAPTTDPGAFEAMSPRTGTASAGATIAATSVLSRSLNRAAARVKAAARDSAALLLPLDALVTIKDYGWSEVTTLSAELADDMGALDMEAHDLASGVTTLYQRTDVGKPWQAVGWAPTSVRTVLQQLGGAMCPALLSALQAAAQPVPPALPQGLSLLGLAGRLMAAAESVSAAASALRDWTEQQAATLQAEVQGLAGPSPAQLQVVA